MELHKFPGIARRNALLKPAEQSSRNLHCKTPTITGFAKDRKRMAFTPTYKRISWNKHVFQDKMHIQHQSEDTPEFEFKLHKKPKVPNPFTDNTHKKHELIKEKIHQKYIPARFLDSHSLEKKTYHHLESKFILPTINTDLELIKTINQESIGRLLTQNKLINDWTASCRSEFKSLTREKRVRFQII